MKLIKSTSETKSVIVFELPSGKPAIALVSHVGSKVSMSEYFHATPCCDNQFMRGRGITKVETLELLDVAVMEWAKTQQPSIGNCFVSFRDEDYTEKLVSVNDIIYAGVPIDGYGNDLILKTEAIIFKP